MCFCLSICSATTYTEHQPLSGALSLDLTGKEVVPGLGPFPGAHHSGHTIDRLTLVSPSSLSQTHIRPDVPKIEGMVDLKPTAPMTARVCPAAPQRPVPNKSGPLFQSWFHICINNGFLGAMTARCFGSKTARGLGATQSFGATANLPKLKVGHSLVRHISSSVHGRRKCANLEGRCGGYAISTRMT